VALICITSIGYADYIIPGTGMQRVCSGTSRRLPSLYVAKEVQVEEQAMKGNTSRTYKDV